MKLLPTPLMKSISDKIRKIFSTDLIKVFSLTGISTFIKLLTSYVTIKVVASIIGPAGIALVGQLQNFISIFITLGAGGINNGIVKYVSENKDNTVDLQKYLTTGFKLTFLFSVVSGVVLIIFCKYISQWILYDESYYYLFIFFGFSLVLTSFNNFFLSVLNGFKEYKKFVFINILTNIISLIFTVILVFIYNLKGSLIALVTYQGIIFIFSLIFLRRENWFSSQLYLQGFSKDILKKYLSYSVMAFVTALTIPVSQLVIRNFIINNYSIVEAGYWEAINKISAMYLMFITTSLSVYYLPKLAEIKDSNLLKKEIFKTYKIMLPLIFITLIIIFCLKTFIINLLFTDSFSPMKDLFLWQLIGDFFKIISWLLAYIMVAKSMTKLYVITEILFASLLVIFTYFLMNKNGLIGATQAYCANYFIYFILMLLIFKKKLTK